MSWNFIPHGDTCDVCAESYFAHLCGSDYRPAKCFAFPRHVQELARDRGIWLGGTGYYVRYHLHGSYPKAHTWWNDTTSNDFTVLDWLVRYELPAFDPDRFKGFRKLKPIRDVRRLQSVRQTVNRRFGGADATPHEFRELLSVSQDLPKNRWAGTFQRATESFKLNTLGEYVEDLRSKYEDYQHTLTMEAVNGV